MYPKIKKSKFIFGKNILLREIQEDDADFLLNLRLHPIKKVHLSATSEKIEDQIYWIKDYKNKDNQAYFIVCDRSGARLGCIRMYDPITYSYSWGSWLMLDGLSPLVSLESALLIYAYGNYLGFDEVRIDVRQSNKFVWRFHERLAHAELINETPLDRFYVVRKNSINNMLEKYSNLITSPLCVKFN